MIDSSAFASFEEASRAALSLLSGRLGFQCWMVTRAEPSEDNWIILECEDHGYQITPGTVLRWSDSFCSRMVAGDGPNLAPRARDVAAFANAPIGRDLQIGAYMGVPLRRSDGTLFGSLCAIDPREQEKLAEADLRLVELIARMLSTLLERELTGVDQQRRIEQLHEESLVDALTGLRNRRGWDAAVEAEEARARRYGSAVSAYMIDLDGLKRVNDEEGHRAGDRLLKRAAACIGETIRGTDIAARVGGDEFGILAVECDGAHAQDLYRRLAAAFAAQGVRASIGWAVRDPRQGLEAALEEADRRMYAAKPESSRRAAQAEGDE